MADVLGNPERENTIWADAAIRSWAKPEPIPRFTGAAAAVLFCWLLEGGQTHQEAKELRRSTAICCVTARPLSGSGHGGSGRTNQGRPLIRACRTPWPRLGQ